MHFIKKLIRVLIVLIGVSLLSFILANLSSVDPAEAIARRIYSNPTQEQIQDIRTEKGLDQPILTQYARWAGNCLHGDLGTSYQSNQPVIQEMAGKLTATLLLVGMALLWIVLITIPLGIVSAVRKDRFCDHLIRIITVLGISIPAFWLGYLLLTAFAIRIPIFKVVDYGNMRSLILPSITLAASVVSSSVRMLRATILENLKKDYVIYAQARGLPAAQILWKHVLKNALPPMVTLFFQNIGMMIGGSAIVESVFSWPGLASITQELAKLGLDDVPRILNSYPHELSGGMLQRIMIALALLLSPELIIADEATTALDVHTQAVILEEFTAIRNAGISMIVVTHNFGVLAKLADDVVVLHDGSVVEHGSVYQIFDKPTQPYTQELLQASNLKRG